MEANTTAYSTTSGWVTAMEMYSEMFAAELDVASDPAVPATLQTLTPARLQKLMRMNSLKTSYTGESWNDVLPVFLGNLSCDITNREEFSALAQCVTQTTTIVPFDSADVNATMAALAQNLAIRLPEDMLQTFIKTMMLQIYRAYFEVLPSHALDTPESKMTLFAQDRFVSLTTILKLVKESLDQDGESGALQHMFYFPDTLHMRGIVKKLLWLLRIEESCIVFIPLIPAFHGVDEPTATPTAAQQPQSLESKGGETKDRRGSTQKSKMARVFKAYTLDLDFLSSQIQADLDAGKDPAFVIATLGSTQSRKGVFHGDDILRLREICTQAGTWLHGEFHSSNLILGSLVEMNARDVQTLPPTPKSQEQADDHVKTQMLTDISQCAALVDSYIVCPGELYGLRGPLSMLMVRPDFANINLPPSNLVDAGRLAHVLPVWFNTATQFTRSCMKDYTLRQERGLVSKASLTSPTLLETLETRFECTLAMFGHVSSHSKKKYSSNVSWKYGPEGMMDVVLGQALFFQARVKSHVRAMFRAHGVSANHINSAIKSVLDRTWLELRAKEQEMKITQPEEEVLQYLNAFFKCCIYMKRGDSVQGFMYQQSCLDSTITPKVISEMMWYLEKVSGEVVTTVYMSLKLRSFFDENMAKQQGFEVVPVAAVQYGGVVGLGAFRFTPTAVPAVFYSSLVPDLNKMLNEQQEQSSFFTVANIKPTWIASGDQQILCHVIPPSAALATAQEVLDLISMITSIANTMPLPRYIEDQMANDIRHAIQAAQLRLDDVNYDGEPVDPNASLVSYIPVIGSLWNWYSTPEPTGDPSSATHDVQVMLHTGVGHTYDLRAQQLRPTKDSLAVLEGEENEQSFHITSAMKRSADIKEVTPELLECALSEDEGSDSDSEQQSMEALKQDKNVTRLLAGLKFVRYSRTPDNTLGRDTIVMTCDLNTGCLVWTESLGTFSFSHPKEESVPVSMLTDIWIGKRTRVFQHKALKTLSVQHCFSIISKTDAFHLEASSQEDRTACVNAIKLLLLAFGKSFVWDNKTTDKKPSTVTTSTTTENTEPVATVEESVGEGKAATDKVVTDEAVAPAPALVEETTVAPVAEEPALAALLETLVRGVNVINYQTVNGVVEKCPITLYYDLAKLAFRWEAAGEVACVDTQCSFALSELCDIYLGKQTPELQSEAAANADAQCCFAMKAVNRYIHIEAGSPEAVKMFLEALKYILRLNSQSTVQAGKAAAALALAAEEEEKAAVMTEQKPAETAVVAAVATATATAAPDAKTASTPAPAATPVQHQNMIVDPSRVEEMEYCASVLVKGIPFSVYTFNKDNLEDTLKHNVILFYRANKTDPDEHGILCWSMVGLPLEYSPNRCIQMNKTVQVCIGKQTRVFQLPSSQEADIDSCCSILVNKMILNIEAGSPLLRQIFLNGFHYLMTVEGKKWVEK